MRGFPPFTYSLKCDPLESRLRDCLVQVGDVIYIEANSGAVKRVGRSDAHATEFDLEAEEYVPLPKASWPLLACLISDTL